MKLKSKLKLKLNLKRAFALLLLSLVFSCDSDEGKFTILNESNFDIDSLYILPDSNKQAINIKKGEFKNYCINMDETFSDGSYFMSFKNLETRQTIANGFGYYTNGYQIEDVIDIMILNDTIMINGEFHTQY